MVRNGKPNRSFVGVLKQEQRSSASSLKKANESILSFNGAASLVQASRSVQSSSPSGLGRPDAIADPTSSDRRSHEPERDNSSTTGNYIHEINKQVISRSFGYELQSKRRGDQTDNKEVVGPESEYQSSKQRKIQNEILRSGERPDYRTTAKTVGVTTADPAA